MNSANAAGVASPLPVLLSGQAHVFEQILTALASSAIIALKGEPGSGKTLVLRHLQARTGGRLLTMTEAVAAIAAGEPDRAEESIARMIRSAFEDSDVVLFDDIALVERLGTYYASRPFYLWRLISVIEEEALAAGRTFVTTTTKDIDETPKRMAVVELGNPRGGDYAAMIGGLTGQDMSNFDQEKLTRTFRRLTCIQIKTATDLLAAQGQTTPSADEYVTVLNTLLTRTNVDLDEVEKVSLDSLVGVDEIAKQLQRTVLIPMTEPDLARELGLKPKRGVLLYGPPGTGKTTVGRALAHAMKGKFFMIDGTFVPGTPEFVGKVDAVLAAAEASSPAVVFIDDADVIFRHGQQPGLARKLLSKLDGLESESQSNVCIVMTAMDVGDMPQALLRSGRVEVWLEMKLPDAKGRSDIINYYARTLTSESIDFDADLAAAATDGFTPADLRGLVADARGHIAYDRHLKRPAKSFEDYLLLAAQDIAARKSVLRSFMPHAA